MATVDKIKDWLKENAPILTNLYENKYVGMAYDRFASFPPKQQKQIIIGTFGGVVAIITGYLFFSYLSLWSYSGKSQKAYSMVNMLLQYQKQVRDKSGQIAQLERNSQLGNPGQLKQLLTDTAKAATISPRMVEVTEADAGPGDDKGAGDLKLKQATVVLQRVNLLQLKNFLNAVEFGPQNLSVSSVKITNDDKIRGYMRVDLVVVAYLFQSADGGGG